LDADSGDDGIDVDQVMNGIRGDAAHESII
jgi:hypothetical protein